MHRLWHQNHNWLACICRGACQIGIMDRCAFYGFCFFFVVVDFIVVVFSNFYLFEMQSMCQLLHQLDYLAVAAAVLVHLALDLCALNRRQDKFFIFIYKEHIFCQIALQWIVCLIVMVYRRKLNSHMGIPTIMLCGMKNIQFARSTITTKQRFNESI